MNEWLTGDFMAISTIFQSYQDDDERLCAMESGLLLERLPPRAGLEPGIARSVGQRLTY